MSNSKTATPEWIWNWLSEKLPDATRKLDEAMRDGMPSHFVVKYLVEAGIDEPALGLFMSAVEWRKIKLETQADKKATP